MGQYKKADEDYKVEARTGASQYHKYVIWCHEDPENPDHIDVSAMCFACKFDQTPVGEPVSREHVAKISAYLSNEVCEEVLKTYAPEKLQQVQNPYASIGLQ